MRCLVRALIAVLAVLALTPTPARARLELAPGFTAQVYVTGAGFAPGGADTPGIPSAASLAIDDAGVLYVARSGRRYATGEQEDLSPLYRFPPGGARLTPATEARFQHGPPLPNPQVGGIWRGRDVLVTTFDRERRVGALYRVTGGRVEYIAGGAAATADEEPVLRQPEGVVVDPAGTIHVADRRSGRVVGFDGDGRIRVPRAFGVSRPRLLAREPDGTLWVGADGEGDAPWQRGTGEIWRVQQGDGSLVLRGPVPVGLAVVGPGRLLVADRQEAELFVLDRDGSRHRFVKFSDGDAPRAVAFVPVTPETTRAGIAGDLFVIVITRGAWPVNEVIRISGPFDRLGGERGAAPPQPPPPPR